MLRISSAVPACQCSSTGLRASRRIIVVGCPGSGKTTFAKRLSGILGVRLVQLDDLHWEPGWRRAEPEVFKERLRIAMACERAVIDGNYAASLPERLLWADAVVYLDVPMATALLGFLCRVARRRWSSDPNLPSQIAPDEAQREPVRLAFVAFIVGFRFRVRPKMERMFAAHPGLKLVRLGSWAECNRLLGKLARETIY